MRQYISKRNRALLAELVRTDFKLRYQDSALGYAWSLLRPLLLFGILYVVFALVLKSGGNIPHFPTYLLLGMVIWNFFSEMTAQSTTSIINRGELIRKISIPRWMIVFATSISALINLCLNLVVIAIVMAINHVSPMASLAWMPLILGEVYVFSFGISLFLSAAYVKFRDVTYIWEVVLQAGIYATPILFSLSLPFLVRHPAFQKIILLNPMAQAIQNARYAVVSHSNLIVTTQHAFKDGWYIYIPFAIVLAVVVLGIWYFKKQSKFFAENI